MLNGILTIPSIQKKYSWVSAVEAGPYHVETTASAANGGNAFRALCGATGYFYCHLNARQIFPAQKCATCQQLSTSGILDIGVAPQGVAGVSGSTEGRTVKAERRPFNVEARAGVGVFEASPVILSENQASPADSKFDVADQEKSRVGSLGGGHPASVPSPEVHDGLTIERIQVAVLNAEMRARHVPNFSVSSEVDPAEDSRFA